MKQKRQKHFASHLFILTFFLLVVSAFPVHSQERQQHVLEVWLNPDQNHIKVEDRITIPESLLPDPDGKFYFALHGSLNPVSLTPGIKLEPVHEKSQDPQFGRFLKQLPQPGEISPEFFSVTLPPGQKTFSIKYQGKIYHPLKQEEEDYARGFSETPGIISSKGVVLSGTSYWYPLFGDHLMTFEMKVHLPQAWNAVSQGNRVDYDRNDRRTKVVWESKTPQNEIFLIGGPFTYYSRKAGPVEAMVFLRQPDEDLANKYLEVTSQYIAMYENLLGAYPYNKFALVENFWETGYGMPSFTLLGSKVIRLPFILHSSYPHEILHNWFGNGVFPNPKTGNWSEGLTAYMADHIIKEQRGKAAEYRRGTLQKYTDYVSSQNDFSLMDFHSRHSSSTEAIGYGKSLMVFHMLRQMLGDKPFIQGLKAFYEKHKFHNAGFEDLREALEESSGKNLNDFFNQWVSFPGAPELKISREEVSKIGEEYRLKATLEQVQAGRNYSLRIPLAVTLKDQSQAYQTTVTMTDKVHTIELKLPAEPMRLDIDPEFDVFRRLNRNEVPPALTQVYGADRVLVLLPSEEKSLIPSYRQLAESLTRSYSDGVEVKMDNKIQKLPVDKTVWILGWENRFLPQFYSTLKNYEVTIDGMKVKIGKKWIQRKDHSLVLTTRHPANPEQGLAWISIGSPAAVPGLARKLPHYHKYSYLAFEGEEPTNIVKGAWPVVNSPMTVFLSEKKTVKSERGKLDSRKALAYLPPSYSKERMLNIINYLSSNELKGRGFGSPELNKAADFIAKKFQEAGLLPAGDAEGSYFQTWKESGGDPPTEATLKNIVGIIPGKKPEWKGQSIVLGAHYDHLGLGWPDVRENNRGKVHPGADDNASGVAVLLELAHVLSKHKPDRTVIFIAFTGEESGLRGSKYFIANTKRFPMDRCLAMINLDTVGRLENRKLMILGSGSAREWPHIFRGAGYMSGVDVATVSKDWGSSDQKSFLDAGIPAVQIFSGAHLDYHSPSDTSEKIDDEGLIKVASVVKEALEYLAGREDALTSSLGTGSQNISNGKKSGQRKRKVSLGTIPDFGYEGEGVRISDVAPGSPAKKSGLSGGDIITQINAEKILDLRQFSEFLKTLKSGDRIKVHFLRDGKPHSLDTKVVSR